MRTEETPSTVGRSLLDAFELIVQPRAAQELDSDVCEQRCLELALLSLGPLSSGPRGQGADDDRRHHVDEQREPVAAVGERERVHRRQEEEVEREHARDRHQDRVGDAPEERNRQDSEDVEHAEAEHRDEVVENGNRRSDDGDRERPGRDAGQRALQRLSDPAA